MTVKLQASLTERPPVFFFHNNWWSEFYLSQQNWDEMKIWEQNNKDQNTLGIYNISPLVTVTHNRVWHATWSHGGLNLLAGCVIILGGKCCLLWEEDILCPMVTQKQEGGWQTWNFQSGQAAKQQFWEKVLTECHHREGKIHTDRQWKHHLSPLVWSFCLN